MNIQISKIIRISKVKINVNRSRPMVRQVSLYPLIISNGFDNLLNQGSNPCFGIFFFFFFLCVCVSVQKNSNFVKKNIYDTKHFLYKKFPDININFHSKIEEDKYILLKCFYILKYHCLIE